jgi:putative membrane protein
MNENLAKKASPTPSDNENRKKKASFLLRILQGAIVGGGGIVPGISGGVFCAIFGFYQPLMEVIAHPFKNIKKHFKLLLPVVIGVAVGFFALAKAVTLLYEWNEGFATALFTGLILGELPSLWKEAGAQGERKRSSYVSMSVAFFFFFTMFAVFSALENAAGLGITPTPFWYGVSGCLVGLGVVVPGMSGSAPLTFMGLYEPMTAAIKAVPESAIAFLKGDLSFGGMLEAMNFAALIPLAIGLLVPFILVAKPINYLLSKKPSQMYHAIFGIVVGTTLPILLYKMDFSALFLPKIGFLVLGFAVAWALDLMSRKYA